MVSPTTPINTHASHAVVYEWRHRITNGTLHYSTYLHMEVTRDGGWDTGQPSPTFFEMMDGTWTEWLPPWMHTHATGAVSLTKLRLSEVLDYDDSSGEPVPVYGDFCEIVDFTGFTSQTSSTQTVGYPSAMLPSYVSVYCLKQKDASPRNINGSIRWGPVEEALVVDNRIDVSLRNMLDTAMNGLIADFQVTAATGGNVVNIQLVIMRKKPASGMAAPWDFTAIPDRFKIRYNVGTQNTRKKTRNTYT